MPNLLHELNARAAANYRDSNKFDPYFFALMGEPRASVRAIAMADLAALPDFDDDDQDDDDDES